jgi:hypothetical protein
MTTHRNNILDKTMHLKRETLRTRSSPHFEVITGPWKCKKYNSYDYERYLLSIAFAIVGISSELNLGPCEHICELTVATNGPRKADNTKPYTYKSG